MAQKPDPSQEYAGYAALTAAFAAGTAAAMAALARRGRLPGRFDGRDLALLGVASYQLSRTITRDRVTAFLRAPFASEQEATGRGEVASEPRGRGSRRAIGELAICPFCMTQWVGAALLVGHCAAPRATRFVTALMAVRTVAEVANIAHEAATAEVDRREELTKRAAAANEPTPILRQ